eukprot:3225146-Prymnesium_polylepis.1
MLRSGPLDRLPTRDTIFDGFRIQHPRACGQASRAACGRVPVRTDALLGDPATPNSHPEQPPSTQHPSSAHIGCLESLPGPPAAHGPGAEITRWSGSGAATGVGGVAAVTVEPTPAMTTVAVVSMSAASPAHREHKHVHVVVSVSRAHEGSSS